MSDFLSVDFGDMTNWIALVAAIGLFYLTYLVLSGGLKLG